MKEFEKITEKEIKTAGVQALHDRPNAYSRYGSGGLTAQELKEAFDKLAMLIAGRYNEIQRALAEGSFAQYVGMSSDLKTRLGVSLEDFLLAFKTGDISKRMMVQSTTGTESLYDTLDTLRRYLEWKQDKLIASISLSAEGASGFALELYNYDEAEIGQLHFKVAKGNLDDDVTEYIQGLIDSNYEDTVQPKINEKYSELNVEIGAEVNARTNAINELKGCTVKEIGYDAQTGVLRFVPVEGETKYIDLPFELTVRGGRYDDESNKLILELANGDEIGIAVGDLTRAALEEAVGALSATVMERIGRLESSSDAIHNSMQEQNENLQDQIDAEVKARMDSDAANLLLVTNTIREVQQQVEGVVIDEQNERVRNDKEIRADISDIKGSNAPTPSEGLEYYVTGNGYMVAGMGTCTDTELVIPATYSGLPVVSIGLGSALNGDVQNIKSIYIPDSVTQINNIAFTNAQALESVEIGAGMSYMGMGCFNSSLLKRIVICAPTPPSTDSVVPFINMPPDVVLEVPEEVIGTYRSQNGYWKRFAIDYGGIFPIVEEKAPSLMELQSQIDDLKKNGVGNGSNGGNYDALIAGLQAQIDEITSSTILTHNSLRQKDEDLQAQITAEKAARESQDNAILEAAAAAIQQNVLALSTIDTQLSAAISNEQTARADKDTDLLEQIAILKARLDAAEGRHVSYGLEYTLNDDGKSYTVSGIGDFSVELQELIIPPTYKGRLVTKIGATAFQSSHIKTVIIPNTIVEIARAAFRMTYLERAVFLGTPQTIIGTAFDHIGGDEASNLSIGVPWSEGNVPGAPWGAINATIYYDMPDIYHETYWEDAEDEE